MADLLERNDESDTLVMPQRSQVLQDIDGRILLFYAVGLGDHSRAKERPEQGYNINTPNTMGEIALHEAAKRGELDDVVFCLHHRALG